MTALMLYAVAVAALLGAAAWAAERALMLYGRPTRMLWLGALVASVAVPLVARLLPAGSPATASAGQPIVITGVQAIERVGRATVSLDAVLGAAWAVMSLALVGWLAWSFLRLKREQRRWTRQAVDGTDVFVSADVGPAVVDPFESAIVVPRWMLDLPLDTQRLALAHERSHVMAGDARLVWAAMLLVAAMPWNAALWWQLRRLRAAVELDCDRRVLGAGAPARRYAELLVDVCAGRGASVLRPALVEPGNLLRWRIDAMTEKRVRSRLARSMAYGSLAAGITFVACDAPAPQVPQADPPAVTGQIAARQAVERAGATDPLYIVDGEIVGNRAPNVDSLEIAVVEVVKGAAAEAMFGARARNGVIRITTKKE